MRFASVSTVCASGLNSAPKNIAVPKSRDRSILTGELRLRTAETMNSQDNRRLMTEYLLGELSAEDRAKFEEQYAVNDDLFEELIAAENDLVDGYASGTLTDVERKHFEAHYLGTPRR